MQNRNIEERLQILNDYIQRTIDALNATRQVAAQTLGSTQFGTPGLSHTGYGWTQGWQQGWQQPQQFVQTPQGLVPVSVNPYFSPVHGLQHSGFVPGFVPNVIPSNLVPNVGYGVQGLHHHQQQMIPNYGYGYGLQHSTLVPQFQNVSPWTNVPMSFVPMGVPQHIGYNQMSGFVPQQNRDLGVGQTPMNVVGQTTI